MGYTNVRDYGEGKKAWIAAGLPLEGRSRRPDNDVDRLWKMRADATPFVVG